MIVQSLIFNISNNLPNWGVKYKYKYLYTFILFLIIWKENMMSIIEDNNLLL